MTEAEEAMYNAMRMAYESEKERNEELLLKLREARDKIRVIRDIVLDGEYE